MEGGKADDCLKFPFEGLNVMMVKVEKCFWCAQPNHPEDTAARKRKGNFEEPSSHWTISDNLHLHHRCCLLVCRLPTYSRRRRKHSKIEERSTLVGPATISRAV